MNPLINCVTDALTCIVYQDVQGLIARQEVVSKLADAVKLSHIQMQGCDLVTLQELVDGLCRSGGAQLIVTFATSYF
jgi:hypothetical protein